MRAATSWEVSPWGALAVGAWVGVVVSLMPEG